jgi:hypothetical protein
MNTCGMISAISFTGPSPPDPTSNHPRLSMGFIRIFAGIIIVAACLHLTQRIFNGKEDLLGKLVDAIPILLFGFFNGLLIFFGGSEEGEAGPAFWAGRPNGEGMNVPNTAHPAGKLVLWFIAVVLLVWFGLADEYYRHDLSHLYQSLGFH